MTVIVQAFKDRERRPLAFFLAVTAACAVSVLASSLWAVIGTALAR